MSENEINRIIAQNILHQLEMHNCTQLELAQFMSVSQATVSNWCKGIKLPRMSKIDKICDFFNIERSDLLEDSTNTQNTSPFGKYRIPVVATVAAGEPIFSEESILEWIDYDKDPRGEVFGLRIKGDSMIPRISDGDTIVVDKSAAWEDGDIVVVTVNGNDGTCKRIKKYKNGISLISLNPSYEPMFFTKSQVEELPVRVVGRVMESRSKF